MSADSSSGPSMVPTMLGSATAGMLARIPFHPIDTIKARLQVQSSAAAASATASSGGAAYRNAFAGLVQVARAEGLRGLYRGFQMAFVGSAPAACLYFTSYEWSREKLTASSTSLAKHESVVHFCAGMAAEAVSCVLWVPIDVIKERMQIQPFAKGGEAEAAAAAAKRGVAPPRVYYRGPIHAIRYTLQNEGLFGLYRGYGATLMSFGPFSALYFVFYEKFKALALGLQDDAQAELPFLAFAACGAAAGAAASFCTNPLDVVKLRLQVQRSGATEAAGAFHYRSMLHGMRELAANEGIRGAFRGVGARMAFHAPATALSISLFEECKRTYKSLLGYNET